MDRRRFFSWLGGALSAAVGLKALKPKYTEPPTYKGIPLVNGDGSMTAEPFEVLQDDPVVWRWHSSGPEYLKMVTRPNEQYWQCHRMPKGF